VLSFVCKTEQQGATGNIDPAPEEIDERRRIPTERGGIASASHGNDHVRDTVREQHSGAEVAEKRRSFHKSTSFSS